MKYIKKYENINKPQIGNFVVCQDQFTKLKTFVNTNIGQYIKFSDEGHDGPTGRQYLIQFKNVPPELYQLFKYYIEPNCRAYTLSEIIFHSKNKKDCEIFLTANKYNL